MERMRIDKSQIHRHRNQIHAHFLGEMLRSIDHQRTISTTPYPILPQSLIQILDQIVHMLDPYTQPYRRIEQTGGNSFFPGNGCVCHR